MTHQIAQNTARTAYEDKYSAVIIVDQAGWNAKFNGPDAVHKRTDYADQLARVRAEMRREAAEREARTQH